MGRNTKITVVAILTLAIAGCSSSDTTAVNSTAAPDAAATKNAVPTVVPNSQPGNSNFPNPVVPGKEVQQTSVPILSKSLIQPTNAEQRRDLLAKGRTDPFAQIGGLVPELPNNLKVKEVPKVPPLPIARAPKPLSNLASKRTQTNKIASKPTQTNKIASKRTQTNKIASKPTQTNKIVALVPATKKPKTTAVSMIPKGLPQVVPNSKLISLLPPTENPDLARAILVTGIVEIGNETQAIIKVPDEPTSRYVQAGQRLVNGVLVKRIEMNQGSNPVLILEQYGVEVERMVGEAPVNPKPTTTASAGTVSANEQPEIN